MIDFCSDSSKEAGEPLAGTAPTNAVYLLLEYRQRWQPKAAKPGNNTLSAAVSDYIQAAIKKHSQQAVKPLFIRQQGRTSGPLALYVAFPTETAPTVFRVDVPDYDALLDLPLADILCGEVGTLQPVTEPVYAVCTHKERDRACGKYGWEVYQALRQQVGAHVWQSTHLGGHRFAGTLLALPSGALYGHLERDEATVVAQAEAAGELYLPRLRGRSCYEKPVQAAAAALRQQLNIPQVTALQLLATTSDENGVHWEVQFSAQGNTYTVTVSDVTFPTPVYKSSGDADPTRFTTLQAQVL